MVMRLFAETLATETNTFSPLPTSLASLPLDGVLPGLRGAIIRSGRSTRTRGRH
jgi:microcystin degradation protein MlrC